MRSDHQFKTVHQPSQAKFSPAVRNAESESKALALEGFAIVTTSPDDWCLHQMNLQADKSQQTLRNLHLGLVEAVMCASGFENV